MVYNKRVIITEIITRRGIKPHYSGFNYLVASVEYLIDNNLVFNRVPLSKELFPQIAANFGVSSYCIERSIRNAVEHTDVYETVGKLIKSVALECYFEINKQS